MVAKEPSESEVVGSDDLAKQLLALYSRPDVELRAALDHLEGLSEEGSHCLEQLDVATAALISAKDAVRSFVVKAGLEESEDRDVLLAALTRVRATAEGVTTRLSQPREDRGIPDEIEAEPDADLPESREAFSVRATSAAEVGPDWQGQVALFKETYEEFCEKANLTAVVFNAEDIDGKFQAIVDSLVPVFGRQDELYLGRIIGLPQKTDIVKDLNKFLVRWLA